MKLAGISDEGIKKVAKTIKGQEEPTPQRDQAFDESFKAMVDAGTNILSEYHKDIVVDVLEDLRPKVEEDLLYEIAQSVFFRNEEE